jgi:hypothetical protein
VTLHVVQMWFESYTDIPCNVLRYVYSLAVHITEAADIPGVILLMFQQILCGQVY